MRKATEILEEQNSWSHKQMKYMLFPLGQMSPQRLLDTRLYRVRHVSLQANTQNQVDKNKHI